MSKLLKNNGFTMIEIILTIVVLSIMAIVAAPQFMTLTDQAYTSSRNNVASAVREALGLWRAQDIVVNGPPGNYPGQLDALANGTQCSVSAPCFDAVLLNGVTDNNWNKLNVTQYRYTAHGTNFDFTYSAAAGTFIQN